MHIYDDNEEILTCHKVDFIELLLDNGAPKLKDPDDPEGLFYIEVGKAFAVLCKPRRNQQRGPETLAIFKNCYAKYGPEGRAVC